MILLIKYFVLLFHLLLTMTFIPSLLPSQTYISFLLLVFIVSLIFIKTGNIKYVKLKGIYVLHISIFLLFIFLSYLAVFLDNINHNLGNYGLALILPIVYITLFFSLLSEIVQKNNFNHLLRIYIYLVFSLSLLSLIGWILFTAELIDVGKWIVNLSESTYNQTHRDEGKLIYSSPYFLGLVLTQGSSYHIPVFSIEYYRSTGFSTEPWLYALFITPSLFFINSETIRSNGVRNITFLVILLTLLVVSSLASIVAAITLTPLYLYKLHLRKTLSIYILSYLILVIYISYSYLKKTYLGVTGSENNNLILSKMEGLITNINDPNNIGMNFFNLFKTESIFTPSHFYRLQDIPVGAIHNILIILLILFGIFLGLRLIFSNNKYWFIGFGILLTSIVLIKGQAHTIMTTPFYLFIFWTANYVEKYNLRSN